MAAPSVPTSSERRRIRQVFPNLSFGRYPTGQHNSLTDVPGLLASTKSIRLPKSSSHDVVNTGVTAILPRKDWFKQGCFAAYHRFNGSGEMTGSHWIDESGLLNSPIIITNSFSVGACYSGVYEYAKKHYADPKTGLCDWFLTPVIAETFDGWLSDIGAMAVTPADVVECMEKASIDPVPEGCTGGGTGMITMGQKAGTGTASRVLDSTKTDKDGQTSPVKYTLAVLVQSNFGGARFLTVKGVPVGQILLDEAEAAKNAAPKDGPEGSIIVVIATDAPLIPVQLKRLAQRATVGVARSRPDPSPTAKASKLTYIYQLEDGEATTRATSSSLSRLLTRSRGKIRRALHRMCLLPSKFSTPKPSTPCLKQLSRLQRKQSVGRARAYVNRTDILKLDNAICMATDTSGPDGREFKAIDLDSLQRIVNKHVYTGPAKV